jgi:hypothetical protein
MEIPKPVPKHIKPKIKINDEEFSNAYSIE